VPLLGLLLGGCQGRKAASEIVAQKELAAVTQVYRPGDAKPTLPTLTTNSPLGVFLTYAMFNQPRVEASYYDWMAAVERITVERSLPDPRLTFKSDVSDTLLSLMPGLMMDLPGPGKLKARANLASAESRTKYYAFETTLLQTAAEVKKAYYQLCFLEDKVHVAKDTFKLLTDLEGLTRSQNEFGKVTMQDVLRAQIAMEKARVLIASLEDSRRPLLAQWNAALGLAPGSSNAPLPGRFETTPMDLSSDQLLATALVRNPRLKAMEAEVQRAEAAITMARKGKVPDFNVGLEADAYAWPTVLTPQAGVTLPIWKDKIAAEIASQQAQRRAATARLSNEQILVAVEFAEQLFAYREATRNLELLQRLLIPKARMSLEVARDNYLANRIDFFNLSDAQKTLLEFQMSEIEARVQRELALAGISLLILAQPPEGAPMLPTSK
jgi:outer membrane protein TolC